MAASHLLSCLSFWVSCACCCTAVSSSVQPSPLCPVRTAFPYTHPLPLAPRLFPSPLCSDLQALEVGGMIWMSYWGLRMPLLFLVLFSTSCRSLCWSPSAKGSFSGEGWEMHWEPGSRQVKASKGESTTITLLNLHGIKLISDDLYLYP